MILDVVFNHTGESDERGPRVSFRRIDNAIYYWLDDDKRFYRDFTSSGQTVNVSHPVVRDLVLDALRYTEHRCVESYRELDPFPLLDMSRILDIRPVHRYVDSHEEFERVARANSPASACLGADGSRAGHCR